MAPEIIKKMPYDCSVDIWAIGVLCFIMLSGKPPFKGRSKDEIFAQITTKNISYSGDIWKTTSKEAQNFCRKMLVRDPKKRTDAETLLKDEWIKKNLEVKEIDEEFLLDVS